MGTIASTLHIKLFEYGGGDGSVIGRSGEIPTGGKQRLDVAQGAKKDIDEDGVVAFCAVVLLLEEIADGFLEVILDSLIALAKISPWRAHCFSS